MRYPRNGPERTHQAPPDRDAPDVTLQADDAESAAVGRGLLHAALTEAGNEQHAAQPHPDRRASAGRQQPN